MHGQLPAADVAAKMAEWDVLLHPSHTEGMSIAVLEALSSGVPVVAVRDVLPRNQEDHPGVYTAPRDSYAEFVAGNIHRFECPQVEANILIDHSEAASLWDKVVLACKRHGDLVERPSRVNRLWRFRPARRIIQAHPRLRLVVRRARQRLGGLGGLHQ